MTDLALVLGISQFDVGLRRVGHVGLVIEDDASALREAEPLVVGVLQVVGDPGLQDRAVDGLQDTGGLRALEPRSVDGQKDVGRAVRALGLHPRDQLVGVAFDPVDGDAGHLFEV